MLADLEKAHHKLRVAGGEALAGAAISTGAILHKLGYADRKEPGGLLATAGFMAGFVAACIRESFRIECEASRLQLRARRRPRRWRWI
jgi:hypothetical protein